MASSFFDLRFPLLYAYYHATKPLWLEGAMERRHVRVLVVEDRPEWGGMYEAISGPDFSVVVASDHNAGHTRA